MITYKLKINYQDPRVMTSDMEFVTGDVGAYRLEFEFYDNGARVDLTDCVLTVKAKRSDGTVLADAGEIQDNLGVFVPKNDIYAVAGELRLEVALADAAKNYITAKVLLATVVEGLGDADNVAQTSASVYVTLLNRVQEQIIAANKLTEDAKSLIDGKLELKADKQTEDGGFAGGQGASTTNGAAIGSGAAATGGGGSVGLGASSTNGGGAIGSNANANAGGAVGSATTVTGYGGAVGNKAKAGAGFSGGNQAAVALGSNGKYIDAIQLGAGTNEAPGTLQVYDYRIMDQDGSITAARLPGYCGCVSSADDLPGYAETGDIYGVMETVSKPQEDALFAKGMFSDYFTSAGETAGTGFAPALCNLRDSIIANIKNYTFTGTDNQTATYLYTASGTFLAEVKVNAGNPSALAAFDAYSIGYNGNDTDIISFYICKQKKSKLTFQNTEYEHIMVWNGTGWEDVRSFHCAKMTPKGSVNQYEDLPDAIDGSLYQLQTSSANWVKYSGKASDLLNIEEDGFHGLKFTPPESCIRKSYLNYCDYLHTYNIVALYDASGNYLQELILNTVPESDVGYPLSIFGISSPSDTVTFYLGIYKNNTRPETLKSFQAGDFVFMKNNQWICIAGPKARENYYTKTQVNEKISASSRWGGSISSYEELPANPTPGLYCYVESDILNGVKYTGKVSDMFSFDESSFQFPYSDTVLFTPPPECLGDTDYSATQKEVYIYNVSGNIVGGAWVNPETFPPAFNLTQLGATSADDTVTFYLGYWNGTNFPIKIEKFSAGSMIFWNGTKWVRIPTVSGLE